MHACIIYLMFLCNTTNTLFATQPCSISMASRWRLVKGNTRQTTYRLKVQNTRCLIHHLWIKADAWGALRLLWIIHGEWLVFLIYQKETIANYSEFHKTAIGNAVQFLCILLLHCNMRRAYKHAFLEHVIFCSYTYCCTTHWEQQPVRKNSCGFTMKINHQEKTKVSQKAKHINSLKPKLSNDNQGGYQLLMFVEGHTSAGAI